jgi:Rho-binding antiterminator
MSDDFPVSCDLDDRQEVSCDLYDRLEAIATLKQECCLSYINEEGQMTKVRGRIVDVYGDEGIEWCKLSEGSQIRLDKIESIEYN